MNWVDAYLTGWFCNLRCPCGELYEPDDIVKTKEHWDAGHYNAGIKFP